MEPVSEKFGDKQFLTAVEKCYTANSTKKFSIALNLLVDIFNEGVWKMYSSFYKMLNLVFTENINGSLLKIDKDKLFKKPLENTKDGCF